MFPGIKVTNWADCSQAERDRLLRRPVFDNAGQSTAVAGIIERVRAGGDRKLDIAFNMLGTEFKSHRDATTDFTDTIGKSGEILDCTKICKGWRRDRRFPFRDTADLRNAADVLIPGQVAARAGLGTLATLEMECLDPGQERFTVAEFCTGQFVEVARVLCLFLGKHPSLAGTNARASPFSTTCHSDFGFLRQRPKTHVRDEDRYLQSERFLGVRANHEFGADFGAFQERFCR